MIGVILAVSSGCRADGPSAGVGVGDAARGSRLIAAYGCGNCHRIPEVRRAEGRVGPPLDQMGRRTLIAGILPNTPPNMVLWLRSPQSVVPGNGMPDMAMSEADARDITAYLYSLQ